MTKQCPWCGAEASGYDDWGNNQAPCETIYNDVQQKWHQGTQCKMQLRIKSLEARLTTMTNDNLIQKDKHQMDAPAVISHMKSLGFLEPGGVSMVFLDYNLDISINTIAQVKEHYAKMGTPIAFMPENPLIDGMYGWNVRKVCPPKEEVKERHTMKSFIANVVAILTEDHAPIGIISAAIFYMTCLGFSIAGTYTGPNDPRFEFYAIAQFFTVIMTLIAIIIGTITGWEWITGKWISEWKPSLNKWGRANSRFTFIEFLVVVAIISILFAMLFPALKNARARSKAHEVRNKIEQTAKTPEVPEVPKTARCKVIKQTENFNTACIDFAIVEFNGHTWVVGEIGVQSTRNFVHDPDCEAIIHSIPGK
jgi:Tfp pilus assembly protein PilE